jgi:hypothetical protein
MRTKDNWIQTFSGKQFWPTDPLPDDVFIEDIAHALSMICRFNGHSKFFYSVAQHSVLVSRFCHGSKMKLIGLLHDASEAYISDVCKPIKPELNGYARIERLLQFVILKRFLGDRDLYNIQVKDIDKRILLDEQMVLLPNTPKEWQQTIDIEPLGIEIEPWTPEKAEYEFLLDFHKLYQG